MILKHADAVLGSLLATSGAVAAHAADAPWWASWIQGIVLGLAPILVKAFVERRKARKTKRLPAKEREGE